jgi:type I restriction enzyme S subunit
MQKLSDLCSFAEVRVAVADLGFDTYISTENMLPNKEGITRSLTIWSPVLKERKCREATKSR